MSVPTLYTTPSFMRRFAAGVVDVAAIIVISFLIAKLSIFAGASKSVFGFEKTFGLYYILLMQYNTLGGMMLRICIINNNGEKISLKKVWGRGISMNLLAILVLGIYYSYFSIDEDMLIFPMLLISAAVYFFVSVSIPFTKTKRSLLDLLSGTRVVCIKNATA